MSNMDKLFSIYTEDSLFRNDMENARVLHSMEDGRYAGVLYSEYYQYSYDKWYAYNYVICICTSTST